MQELKEKLDQSKEEIGQIQSKLKLFQKTTAVKRQHETSTGADSKPSFVIPERSPAVSLANEVQYDTNIQYNSLFTHVSSNELKCSFKIIGTITSVSFSHHCISYFLIRTLHVV